MSALNLGIVGCGDVAGYSAWFCKLIPQIRLAACCDANPQRLQAFARRFNIRETYTDYEALIASPNVDALYLAVPHHLHHAMLLGALAAGKPTLVEKPLARTFAEGRELAQAVEHRGVKVGVNYQYRYDVGCYGLARAVQAGALGRVHSARINVPWKRGAGYFEGSTWHARLAEAGGGTLITQGSHFLDVVLWALGERPLSAVGYTARPGFEVEVETLAHGLIELSGGALVNISSTMAAAQEGAVTIEVYGERGAGFYTDRPTPRVKIRGGDFGGSLPRLKGPPVRGLHALHRSLAAFARWALGGAPYLCTAADALPVLAAVDAIYRSAASGRRESVAGE